MKNIFVSCLCAILMLSCFAQDDHGGAAKSVSATVKLTANKQRICIIMQFIHEILTG